MNHGKSGKMWDFYFSHGLAYSELILLLKLIFLLALSLSSLTIPDPPHPLFFHFVTTCIPAPPPHPPLIALSPYFFLSAFLAHSVFKFAWTQRPCLLRKWVKHRHTCAHTLYVHTLDCTYKPPFHYTQMYTCTACYMAKLGFAAFGRHSTLSQAPLSLTSWCSVYMSCQSQPNQSFSLWAQTSWGLRRYALSGYVNSDLTIAILKTQCSHLCKCCSASTWHQVH